MCLRSPQAAALCWWPKLCLWGTIEQWMRSKGGSAWGWGRSQEAWGSLVPSTQPCSGKTPHSMLCTMLLCWEPVAVQ